MHLAVSSELMIGIACVLIGLVLLGPNHYFVRGWLRPARRLWSKWRRRLTRNDPYIPHQVTGEPMPDELASKFWQLPPDQAEIARNQSQFSCMPHKSRLPNYRH